MPCLIASWCLLARWGLVGSEWGVMPWCGTGLNYPLVNAIALLKATRFAIVRTVPLGVQHPKKKVPILLRAVPVTRSTLPLTAGYRHGRIPQVRVCSRREVLLHGRPRPCRPNLLTIIRCRILRSCGPKLRDNTWLSLS